MLALGNGLRGSGCTPYNADMAARTREYSIRYPDVTVYCGRDNASNDDLKAFDDPKVIVEVLSGSTARTDLRIKLEEYKELASVDAVVFVDIAAERLRIVRRTGPDGWNETIHRQPVALDLPTLGVSVTHDEIFGRD